NTTRATLLLPKYAKKPPEAKSTLQSLSSPPHVLAFVTCHVTSSHRSVPSITATAQQHSSPPICSCSLFPTTEPPAHPRFHNNARGEQPEFSPGTTVGASYTTKH